MASPHPQPTALAKLKGADKQNPQRYRNRAHEPRPVLGVGDPPAWLGADGAAVWASMQAEIAPGVLTRQDRRMFGVLCSLVRSYEAAPDEMSIGRLSTLSSIASQFGMTPSARTKVAAIEAETEDSNPFAEFAPNLRAVS